MSLISEQANMHFFNKLSKGLIILIWGRSILAALASRGMVHRLTTHARKGTVEIHVELLRGSSHLEEPYHTALPDA